jgi:hypothetical protein
MPTVHTQRRRTCWVYAKRTRRRHLGDVTVVLSPCRRHDGPKQTKLLVTHRPETVTAREVVGVYVRKQCERSARPRARKGLQMGKTT